MATRAKKAPARKPPGKKKTNKWLTCADCKLTDAQVKRRADDVVRCDACDATRDAEARALLQSTDRLDEARCSDCTGEPIDTSLVLCADDKWRHGSCRAAWLTHEGLPEAPIAEIQRILRAREFQKANARMEQEQAAALAEHEKRLLSNINAGSRLPDGRRRPRQRKLDPERILGDEIPSQSVRVERVEKTGAKLTWRRFDQDVFAMSITDDDATEARALDPVSRRAEIARRMRCVGNIGGRAPNGADYDQALEELVDRVVEGGW